MTGNNEWKDRVQYWSAAAMLVTGGVMAFTSLLLPPMGEISNGALWYTGQCFLFAGGVYGIGSWARSKGEQLDEKMDRMQEWLDEKINEKLGQA